MRDVSRGRILPVRERHVGSASLSSLCVPSRSEPASEPMISFSRRRRSFLLLSGDTSVGESPRTAIASAFPCVCGPRSRFLHVCVGQSA